MYGYRESTGCWQDLEAPGWSLWGWRAAADREPGIRPLGDYVVVLQDPYPEQSRGGIHYAPGAMEHVGHVAQILAVPHCMVREVPRGAILVRVHESGYYRDAKDRLRRMSVTVGDRVLMIRFAGYQSLPDVVHPRLRLVRHLELWGRCRD